MTEPSWKLSTEVGEVGDTNTRTESFGSKDSLSGRSLAACVIVAFPLWDSPAEVQRCLANALLISKRWLPSRNEESKISKAVAQLSSSKFEKERNSSESSISMLTALVQKIQRASSEVRPVHQNWRSTLPLLEMSAFFQRPQPLHLLARGQMKQSYCQYG